MVREPEIVNEQAKPVNDYVSEENTSQTSEKMKQQMNKK